MCIYLHVPVYTTSYTYNLIMHMWTSISGGFYMFVFLEEKVVE